MLWTISLLAFSFALSVLLTPLVRGFALRRGWVDRPDNLRKMHKVPIPRIGGVPIVLAYTGSLGLLLVGASLGFHVNSHLTLVWKLLLPAFLVFVVGLLDDLITLQPWVKVSGEIIAALVAYTVGIQMHNVLGYPIGSLLGVPLTVIWLVGCTNAFNLIDGLDGLAAGIGLLAALTTLLAGLIQGDAGLVAATAPLAGALGAFLIFNFKPASIFLGDGGSLWVGFMLACYGVIWGEKSLTAISIIAPIMALSIPLLDTALSIARRYLRRQSIFNADRGHIHHRLVERGLSQRRAVLLLYAAGAIGASFSLLQTAAPATTRGLIVAVFCFLIWVGIRYLGYREFALAANLLRRNTLRCMLQSDYSLQAYEKSLTSARTIEDCWCIVRAIAREFIFTQVELKLAGRSYREEFDPAGTNGHWVVHIPLSDSEYVRFNYQFGASSGGLAVAQLADVLHRGLSSKSKDFMSQVTPINGAISLTNPDADPAPTQVSLTANA